MKPTTPTNCQQRRAFGASSRSESIKWKERHDALMDVLAGILYAKGDGPERRLAIGKPYFDQPRRPVVVEPLGDRVVIHFDTSELPLEESPAPWARFVAWLRSIIRR